MPLRDVSVARNEVEHICATCERIERGVPVTRCVVSGATATASNNVGTISIANLGVYGFVVSWTVPANGLTDWLGTYKTNGN